MLKDYRKRFVLLTMSLITLILVIVFIALGIFMYRQNRSELRNTMQQVIEPWNSRRSRLFMEDSLPPHLPEDALPVPPELPENERGERRGELPESGRASDTGSITTVFYDRQTDTFTVLSGGEGEDTDSVKAAALQAQQSEKSFGTLGSLGYIYYKEDMGGMCKIALAETSYLSSRLVKNVVLLALVLVLSLALFFFISVRLSKLAAKPLEKAVAMERQFVADISHDLKTPVTVILANSSILRESPDSKVSEQMQWIDSTDTAAKNMMNLVSEMLTLSSLESPGRTVKKEPVSLSSAAEKSVLQMESVAYDRGVTVDSDIEPDIVISADPLYIPRICDGLLENALKYEPDGGCVSLTLKRQRKSAVLTVRNAGSSISEEDLPHIFERFYRGDKSRSMQKGHGLGLPIIKQMTDILGADIRAESPKESGTVFTVTFELAE